MKRIILLAGVSALIYGTSCNQKKEVKEEIPNYSVTSPLQIDTSFTKEYVSQIKSVRNIEIRSQEKGYLQNIYVDEGQHVKAGQLLFRIMPTAFEAEVKKSEAEAKESEIELQNTKMLSDKNIVSKNELAVAKAKLEQARAETSLAKVHLSFTEIRAPFDGIIDRIPMKLGSLIDEGQLLTNLSDNNQMFAYFNVSEPEYLNYENSANKGKKQPVSLVMANGDLLKYKGEVETVESEFDSETGNIAFRARFPNPDQLLKNGETGKIEMVVPIKNALVIPQKATYEIQDKSYVFIVDKNNKVRSREISIASELPDLYIVGSGLNPGDKILLEGVQKVKDDDKIAYRFQDPKNVIGHLRVAAE
ncbi:efflux RND transporter periplasmic adaptor subunit [Pedobacter sp. HMF7647]|uniref:Efflux RND transporter periplasmic adaptor subunit n=1 Tax=Hufsiella arboris TaxID=2695275 RepID=A0A7K1YA77_9SPHI|nr:efflux RND transporter periplasmic adaptor subunit [Hufsiella arboris]MXV51271.1 efflux RND transporter periplasmic adaptor subunit [Hufsiella arboris]